MKRLFNSISISIILFCSLFFYSPFIHADVLWDTGAGSRALSPGDGIYPFGFYLTGGAYAQYAAGRLDLADDYTITLVQGYMATDGSYSGGTLNMTGGMMTIAIYSQDISTDSPNSLLYRSNQFALADGSTPGWYGAGGLNFFLPAGSYWFSLEPVDGDFNATIPQIGWWPVPPSYPPNPMHSYKFFYGAYSDQDVYYPGSWYSNGGAFGSVFGIRIEGTPGPQEPPITTPEPTSLALLGLGLIGLAWVRKKLN